MMFPAVPVTLFGPGSEEQGLPILDTGAAHCLFNGERANRIGLDLLSGRPLRLSLLTGSLTSYLHEIVLEIEGHRFLVEAAFSSGPIRRELLGRHSLFEQTTWAIRESRQEIYFSPRP